MKVTMTTARISSSQIAQADFGNRTRTAYELMTRTQLAALSRAGLCSGRLGNEDDCEDGRWKRSFTTQSLVEARGWFLASRAAFSLVPWFGCKCSWWICISHFQCIWAQPRGTTAWLLGGGKLRKTKKFAH